MSSTVSRFALAAVLAALAHSSAGAQELQGTVSVLDGVVSFQPSAWSPGTDPGPLRLTITCGPGVPCNELRVFATRGGAAGPDWAASADQESASFEAPFQDRPTDATITVARGEAPIATVPLTNPVPEADKIVYWGLRPCTDTTAIFQAATQERGAVYLVTPQARLLRRTRHSIDEGEALHVYVIGRHDEVGPLAIQRISKFRDLDTYPILGGDATIPVAAVKRNSADDCHLAYSMVENFAGGAAGQVVIRRATFKDDGTPDTTRLGTFDVAVNRTYRGSFALGVATTSLADPTFALVDDDSTVTRRDAGGRNLFTLFFTPYVLGRRTAEPWRIREVYRYVNPTVGIVVDDVPNNILYGLAADLPAGISLMAGRHTGRVTRIPKGAPPPGTSLAGSGRDLQTEEAWQSRWFGAASLDLRAAAALLGRLTK
jgi:hypothetical protein